MTHDGRNAANQSQPPVPPGPEDGLLRRVVHGGLWVMTLRVATRALYLARTIVLARLLSPDDFGLFGIALLTMGVMEALSQTGLQAALIQKKDDIASYLHTAWAVQAVRGLILALVLFGLAPFVAAFFGEPSSEPLLRVLSLSFLLNGATSIGVVYFQKDLEFHKQFVYQFSATVADFSVAVVAAVLLRNAWALVLGVLAGYLVGLIVSFAVHPYRPGPRIEWSKARELFRFGRWVFSSSLLNYAVHSVDSLVVGKLLNATALGLYQMAFRLSNAAATEITNVVSQVAFPTYSRLQDDTARLREAALHTLTMASAVSLPLAGGVFVLAPDLTGLLLGEKWMPMVPVLQLLCVSGALRSVTANFGSVFLAAGRPDIQTKASTMDLAILVIGLYPLVTTFGMMGAVYARFLTFASQLYVWSNLMTTLGADISTLARSLLAPLVGTIVMTLGVGAAKYVTTGGSIVEITLLIVLGASLYLATVFVIDHKYHLRISEQIRAIRTAIS